MWCSMKSVLPTAASYSDAKAALEISSAAKIIRSASTHGQSRSGLNVQSATKENSSAAVQLKDAGADESFTVAAAIRIATSRRLTSRSTSPARNAAPRSSSRSARSRAISARASRKAATGKSRPRFRRSNRWARRRQPLHPRFHRPYRPALLLEFERVTRVTSFAMWQIICRRPIKIQ